MSVYRTSMDRLVTHLSREHPADLARMERASKAKLQRLHGSIQKRDGKCGWRA